MKVSLKFQASKVTLWGNRKEIQTVAAKDRASGRMCQTRRDILGPKISG